MPNIIIDGLDQKIQDELPADLAVQFRPLFKDIFWLGMKWHEYSVLFGSKESVDLLNRTAGYLFLIVQDTMWDDLLLHISRLVGAESSLGKQNLTIRRISGLIDSPDLREEISPLIDACIAHCSFVSDHRNKRLAHIDLQVAVGEREEHLTGVSRLQIRQAVEMLQEIIRLIYAHYADVHFVLDTNLRTGNADSLVQALTIAERSRGER